MFKASKFILSIFTSPIYLCFLPRYNSQDMSKFTFSSLIKIPVFRMSFLYDPSNISILETSYPLKPKLEISEFSILNDKSPSVEISMIGSILPLKFPSKSSFKNLPS